VSMRSATTPRARRRQGGQSVPDRAGGGRGAGSTLIEILVAALILAILALGGGAYLYHAQLQLSLAQDERVALQTAIGRIEDLEATPYNAITNSFAVGTNVFYLDKLTGAWSASATNRGETVVINGPSRPITTTAQFVDADGGSLSYDCLRVSVSVGFNRKSADAITLRTVLAP
jgi:type II secretory pathway pseudopilin PulG